MVYIAHIKENHGIEDIQSLEQHLSGVSKVSGILASKIGLKKIGELMGLLHDLGKYSESFQNYIGSKTDLIDQYYDEKSGTEKLPGPYFIT